MRFLFVTTIGSTLNFFIRLTEELIKEGHTVDVAANETIKAVPKRYDELGCRFYHISCSRSPLDICNIKAVNELKKIVKNNRYDIVHCHTPIAGVCTRIACKSLRDNGLRAFYTAHGFHFYKGASLKNWIIYYPFEKVCSHFTDTLITINHEDYELAKRKMKSKDIEYVPGVGVDIDKFKNTVVNREKKRKELGIPQNAFLLVSVGELNKNKNHEIVIRALAKLNNPNIHYMIAGVGSLHDYLFNLAKKLNIEHQVHLLGYVNGVEQLYKIADVDVFPSIREGLGLAAIEGMAAGLPLVCSDNRGTREYAVQGKTAFVCYTLDDYVDAISLLSADKAIRDELVFNGMRTIERYSDKSVIVLMRNIYCSCSDIRG